MFYSVLCRALPQEFDAPDFEVGKGRYLGRKVQL
jgi:hypothetical protein